MRHDELMQGTDSSLFCSRNAVFFFSFCFKQRSHCPFINPLNTVRVYITPEPLMMLETEQAAGSTLAAQAHLQALSAVFITHYRVGAPYILHTEN